MKKQPGGVLVINLAALGGIDNQVPLVLHEKIPHAHAVTPILPLEYLGLSLPSLYEVLRIEDYLWLTLCCVSESKAFTPIGCKVVKEVGWCVLRERDKTVVFEVGC